MAHLRCDFFAESLTLSTSMTVILPERAAGQIGMGGADSDAPPPVLYLLHGLSDDDTIWLRRTSIERYVSTLGLAVVMPQVHRSFYADEAYGEKFWTFVSEELPAVVQSFFRVSVRTGRHLRGRVVDGRLRCVQARAAASGSVRRRGFALRGPGLPRRRRSPTTSSGRR